jgi:ribonuclease D
MTGDAGDFIPLDDQAAFDACAGVFRDAETLAVDTESDSLYRYRERVCFLQIGVRGRAYLVDTLAVRDLGAFADACANPAQQKILHGADYDVACLRRDFDVRFANLFDTMIASQLIGREQLGLAALVREFHGVELDKSLTTHDWGRRPLETKYVRYLADDVIYLEDLRDRLHGELAAADALEEAAIEFRRVAATAPGRGGFDPESFRRIKGARDLNRVGLSALRELNILRDRVAAAADKPPFKILGNQTLIDVARRLPRTLEELRPIRGFSDYVLGRIGSDVLEAVRVGVEAAPELPLRAPRNVERPSDERLAAAEGLRAWRKEAARKDGRTTMLVLPNHLLARVAEALPKTVAELARIADLGAARVARYGREIVAVTADPPPLESFRRPRRGGPAADGEDEPTLPFED